MKPYFSIIVPSLNEEVNLPILLESLTKQTYKEFEVISVDCFSKDKTKINAEKYSQQLPSLNFISYKSKNVSDARNHGASKAQGEFLIFFDADVQTAPDFLQGIKQHIDQKNLDMLTVWNRPKKEANLTGKITLTLLNIGMALMQKINPAMNGPCMIIKRTVFEKIQGFNDEIVFGEDYDITKRAVKQKVKFAIFTKPEVYVSSRRFEKEGFFLTIYKSVYALIYQQFKGPITKPLFEYKMGGQNFT